MLILFAQRWWVLCLHSGGVVMANLGVMRRYVWVLMKYADTTNCTRGWGKVPMYHPSFMSANERAASLSFDQSEDEKLVHDPSDEFLAVTIQGDNSDLEHLYQERLFYRKFFATGLLWEINGFLCRKVANLRTAINCANFRSVVLSDRSSGGT